MDGIWISGFHPEEKVFQIWQDTPSPSHGTSFTDAPLSFSSHPISTYSMLSNKGIDRDVFCVI